MIDIVQLREIHPVLCYAPKGDTVTFEAIKRLIGAEAQKHGVPVAFSFDEIISEEADSVIVEDCLIVYHPEHTHDYISFVFRIRRDGDSAFIIKNEYGASPRMLSTDMLTEADKELEAEKRYYLAMRSIFEFVKC